MCFKFIVFILAFTGQCYVYSYNLLKGQIASMKFFVQFDKSIGVAPIQKQADPLSTVQDLQIHISLSFQDMQKCKLYYKGKHLKDKQQKLNTIFETDNSIVNQVTVVPLNDLQSFSKDTSADVLKITQYMKNNPLPCAAVVGVIIVIILTLMS